jgi:hypothetical protein
MENMMKEVEEDDLICKEVNSNENKGEYDNELQIE